jgi:hypothetical protein
MSNYYHKQNLVDLYDSEYQSFAERVTQHLLGDLAYHYEQDGIWQNPQEEAKAELDRKMQSICDKLEYYGFKPTCYNSDKC